MAGHNGQAGESVMSKVMRILDVFTAERSDLTAAEISRRSRLPHATVHRLLTELVSHDALERSPSGTYSVGVRLWEIGALAPGVFALRSAALPYMQGLREASGRDVHLNVLAGREGVRVEMVSDRRALVHSARLRIRFPLHATSGGQVLLAHAASEQVDRILGAPLPRLTDRTIASSHQLRQVLAEIRRTGIAVSSEECEVGTVGVAAPVFGPPGSAVASLEVVTPVGGEMRQLRTVVRAAACNLSGALRGSAGGWSQVGCVSRPALASRVYRSVSPLSG